MDRAPKPAPFPVGTRLRYVGSHHSYYLEGAKKIPIVEPGMIVEIAVASPGRRGSLRQLRDENGPMYYEDDDEPILDETRDGYSVYHAGGNKNMGRIIRADTAHEWELV